MKKLVFIFAIMLGASFASCNSSSNVETESVDSVEVATDSVEVVDSIVEVDSVAVDSVQ